ncbi:MAG: class I SAM-dependent methyltransferase [Bacteroidia bacterium]
MENFIKQNTIAKHNGSIFKIMEPAFEESLNLFLNKYEDILSRENHKLTQLNYNELPCETKGKDSFEWYWRSQSKKVVFSEIFSLKGKKVLEIGPWNGWLSHHLHKGGADLLCLDYFVEPPHGLRTKEYYHDPSWTSVQCDIENLDFLVPGFDYIILNHQLQFCSDPQKLIEQLFPLLNRGGKMLIIGMTIFQNPLKKEKKTEQFRKYYLNNYQFDIFFRPTKAYFDKNDKKKLEDTGFQIKACPGFRFRNFLSFIDKRRPFYCYGCFSASN